MRILNFLFKQRNLKICINNISPLQKAVEKNDIELVKLLLQNEKIDINLVNIFFSFFHTISNSLSLSYFNNTLMVYEII